MAEACTVQEPYSPEMFSMIGREDTLNGSLSTRCPDIILGEFLVSYTDSSGQSECPNGALLDVCHNKNQMAFNYSLCGNSNSLPENSNCVYSHVDSATATTYISIYSQTESKFYCMAASEDGNQTVYLSQHQNDCSEGQNSTTVVSTGRLMSLTIEVNSTGKCDVEPSDVITTDQSSTPISSGTDGDTLNFVHFRSI
ncbi:hypothetical protein LOTGIDRAFT_156504 [Lottia gigantea]|uniref:DUF7042 domain-containing protein n=1 Tax=Lottia gigantea TaxID=225164 RepID=V4B987_LOTGI|nr:hypothetical protein LOTGIDRAFT_156504 [Lottia gigantea]ESP03906.1 hypothetical protein LOTGIDRAFT_156504 [Lottia gigantea]